MRTSISSDLAFFFRQASCYVITPSDNVAGVELEGNDWSVAHHAGSMVSNATVQCDARMEQVLNQAV